MRVPAFALTLVLVLIASAMLVTVSVSAHQVAPQSAGTVHAMADDPKFYVSDTAGCDNSIAFFDADCWALTSGGVAGFTPDSDDSVTIDSLSGTFGDARIELGGTPFTTTGAFVITSDATADAVFNEAATFGSLTIESKNIYVFGPEDGGNGALTVGPGDFIVGSGGSVFLSGPGTILTITGNFELAGNFGGGGDEGDCEIVLAPAGTVFMSGAGLENLYLCALVIDSTQLIRFQDDFAAGPVRVDSAYGTVMIDAGNTWTTHDLSYYYSIGTMGGPNVLFLLSSSPGDPWFMNNEIPRDAFYVEVSDSDASGGAPVNSPETEGNVDGGGNTNWVFTKPRGGGGGNPTPSEPTLSSGVAGISGLAALGTFGILGLLQLFKVAPKPKLKRYMLYFGAATLAVWAILAFDLLVF